MLDSHNSYLFEQMQSQKAQELYRVANEPSWVERLLGLAWLPLRPVVHLLGRGLQVVGGLLVRRTERPDSTSTAPARLPVTTHLDQQAG